MSGRWGPEGPPDDAYSRVSDPQRFEGLHDVADEILAELERRFDVTRSEALGVDAELERGGVARPTIRLVPRNVAGAPIAVSFTTFPGVRMRAGNWLVRGFPFCGCDACDETIEGETRELKAMVEDVVAGRFREAIRITDDGAWLEQAFWGAEGSRSSGRSRLDMEKALSMVAGVTDAAPTWNAWPAKSAGFWRNEPRVRRVPGKPIPPGGPAGP